MLLPNDGQRKRIVEVGRIGQLIASGRARLAREVVSGRYQPGQSVQLREIADHYELDDESVLETFAELQALGMVNVIGNSSAIIHSPNPKEMQEPSPGCSRRDCRTNGSSGPQRQDHRSPE